MEVKIEKTERGLRFINAYKVIGITKKSGNARKIRTFLTEEKAEEYIDFAKRVFDELYIHFYILSETIWID